MISSLILQIEERKSKLITLFENNKNLPLKKQQEILGAINELDNIIKILDDLRETEEHKENNPDDIFLYRPVNNGIFDFIK